MLICIIIDLQNLNTNFIIDKLMELKVLLSLGFLSLVTLMLIFSVSGSIYAGDGVKWKTFNEKNGIFTIQYPSNWSPLKVDNDEDEEYSTSLINSAFVHQGKGTSFAFINLYAETESIFTNITDKIDSNSALKQNNQKYKVIQPIECGKYTINGIGACSLIEEFKLEIEDNPVKPLVRQLTVAGLDDDGTEYLILYTASQKQFGDILPVAAQMIKSFDTTGAVSEDGEATAELGENPELPPLS